MTAPDATSLRVVIAEDAVLLREGLRRVLSDSGLEVVGVAGNATELLAAVESLRPDVVLADIRMPPTQTTEGLQAALQIRRQWPGTSVVVVSQHVETQHLFELLADDPRGVGYVLKERVANIGQFADAIRRVAAGESVIDPDVVSRLVARPRRGSSPVDTLTEQRARGARPHGRGPVEPGHRRRTLDVAQDGRDPRREHLHQARPGTGSARPSEGARRPGPSPPLRRSVPEEADRLERPRPPARIFRR